MSRRASRPGTHSTPEPPRLIVEKAFDEPEVPRARGSATRRESSTCDDDPVVPDSAPSDDPRVWGDASDTNDQRLKDGVPPHW